mgnify:CR=1 FL=1
MSDSMKYVVEQRPSYDGTRVVVKQVPDSGKMWFARNFEMLAELSVLGIAGLAVAGAAAAIIVWDATLWALWVIVGAVLLIALVAGVAGPVFGRRFREPSSNVVVDHVFEFDGEFGKGLEELLNDETFGPEALKALEQAGKEEDVEVIGVVNEIWAVYRRSLRVGKSKGNVLKDISERMVAWREGLDEVDGLSRH